jgi:hypothetical protein
MSEYIEAKWNTIYKVYGVTQRDRAQFIHKFTKGAICNNRERLETMLLDMLLRNIELSMNELLEGDWK